MKEPAVEPLELVATAAAIGEPPTAPAGSRSPPSRVIRGRAPGPRAQRHGRASADEVAAALGELPELLGDGRRRAPSGALGAELDASAAAAIAADQLPLLAELLECRQPPRPARAPGPSR